LIQQLNSAEPRLRRKFPIGRPIRHGVRHNRRPIAAAARAAARARAAAAAAARDDDVDAAAAPAPRAAAHRCGPA
jgi:hypothetical protein